MHKIDRVMAEFRTALLAKFRKKEAKGYVGWDKQPMWGPLVAELAKHIKKNEFSSDDLIDIALICMFLWNLEVS